MKENLLQPTGEALLFLSKEASEGIIATILSSNFISLTTVYLILSYCTTTNLCTCDFTALGVQSQNPSHNPKQGLTVLQIHIWA